MTIDQLIDALNEDVKDPRRRLDNEIVRVVVTDVHLIAASLARIAEQGRVLVDLADAANRRAVDEQYARRG